MTLKVTGKRRQRCVGGRGDSNLVVTIDRFIVTNLSLGTEPNDPLAYVLGLELHHLIMTKLGGHGGL